MMRKIIITLLFLIPWIATAQEIRDMDICVEVAQNGSATVITDWKSKRSLEEKAGRSGLVKTKRGYELCWGQGSLGDQQGLCGNWERSFCWSSH